MLVITSDSLKGYILEEVLAYLIKNTGYRLLVDSEQDPDELSSFGNGIHVIGRGGTHQVDVLGELSWIPAFTFPIRLFVEAKFRSGKTGIDAVRNAIATLLDINDKHYGENNHSALRKYYRYVYALFSTSGFSANAARMALAHQISLVDLSGNEFDRLRMSIAQSAQNITSSVFDQNIGYPIFRNRRNLVSYVRRTLRNTFETWPLEQDLNLENETLILSQYLSDVVEEAMNYGELFVAMASGPFMLLLKADDPNRFIEYAERYPRHRITISWDPLYREGRTWFINPVEDSNIYQLHFRLPEILSRWIFTNSQRSRSRALATKQSLFSDITIYRHIQGRDFLYRLEYDAESTNALI